MDLYKFHDKPEELDHHDIAHLHVPVLLKEKLEADFIERRRWRNDGFTDAEIRMLAKDPATAYWIAVRNLSWGMDIIPKKYFPLFDKTVATSPRYALFYAEQILNGPWVGSRVNKTTAALAEKTIASNAHAALGYALGVLRKPWPQGEKAIMGSAFEDEYEKFKADYKP
jgi:hypothetical protein